MLYDAEYIYEFKRKLVEGIEEFNTSNDAEESSDILEILFAIMSQMECDPLLLDELRGNNIHECPLDHSMAFCVILL